MEFGRAIVDQRLSDSKNQQCYIGFVRDHQKDVIQMIEESVYTWWDQSSEAPAKKRPREAASTPSLGILLWEDDRPRFPKQLLEKFPRGSEQHGIISGLAKHFHELWPEDGKASSASPLKGTAPKPVSRAVGSPEFAADEILDLEREISLLTIPSQSFAEERPGFRCLIVFTIPSESFNFAEERQGFRCFILLNIK